MSEPAFGIIVEQGLTCGCPDRKGHVAPHVDPALGLEHGERSALNDDPLPHHVPGTGTCHRWASPDAYCLCGHPNYLSCMGFLSGGSIGGAIIYDRNQV